MHDCHFFRLTTAYLHTTSDQTRYTRMGGSVFSASGHLFVCSRRHMDLVLQYLDFLAVCLLARVDYYLSILHMKHSKSQTQNNISAHEKHLSVFSLLQKIAQFFWCGEYYVPNRPASARRAVGSSRWLWTHTIHVVLQKNCATSSSLCYMRRNIFRDSMRGVEAPAMCGTST